MADVALTAFDPARDLAMLADWLRRPHVARWWGDPAHALGAVRRHPVATGALIEAGDRPVGFVCWQTPPREELAAAGLGDLRDDLVDVDILIGEPDALGRGVGPEALSQLLARLRADGVRLVGLAAAIANRHALRAYEKAGFRPFRDFEDAGQAMRYFVRTFDAAVEQGPGPSGAVHAAGSVRPTVAVSQVEPGTRNRAAAHPIVRAEEPQDRPSVRAVHASAFETMADADLVDALRERASPIVSLVADVAGEVAGRIMFSPVSLDRHPELRVMGLGPMAVAPAHQRKGIGSALVRAGLERCGQLGCGAVVVLGHPSYYPRFGFRPAARFGIGSEYEAPEAFMLVELRPGCLAGVTGTVRYHAAFKDA